MLHRLSFACPRNVSQDGPPGVGCRSIVRSEHSAHHVLVDVDRKGERDLLCDPRTSPTWGCAGFMSTMASTSALDGPWGPVRRRVGENSQRYLRVRRARWNSRIVDGLSTIAERITRAGRMNSAHTPARIRSDAQRFGRPVPRAIQNEQLLLDQDRFSQRQTAGRRGPSGRARVAIRCTSRMIGSRIGTS